jgi:hypothetical protein
VYETSSVDVTVSSLNVVVVDAMGQTIPRGFNPKFQFPPPPGVYNNLWCYIVKKYFHRRFKKNRSDYFYDNAFYRELVKNIVKSDGRTWLKSVDNNLKSQPQHFWKYVSNFRKHRSGSVQLEVHVPVQLNASCWCSR